MSDKFIKNGVCDFVSKFKYDEYQQVLDQIPDDPNQLDKMHQDLKQAFKTGRTLDIEFRIQQLRSMQTGLEEMKDEICEAISKDLGRSTFLAYIQEVAYCTQQIQHTIDHVHEWAKPTIVNTPLMVGPGTSSINPEPLGVVAILGAWNFPVSILLGPLQEVIGAGNCAIVKPPEFAPNSAFVMAKFIKNYLDNKFFKCILGQA